MALHDADLFAALEHLVDGLVGNVAAGAHGDDDLFGIRSAFILEGLVNPAGQLGDFVHALFHDGGNGSVEVVGGFTALEVDIAVLGGTGLMRMFRIQGAGAVRKPSKKCRNGTELFRVARWATRAMSWASWTELLASMAKPVWRQAMTSLWSPKMFRA